MNPFNYRDGDLYCEDVRLEDIAAEAGTPAYVYSAHAILERFAAYDRAFGDLPHTVCYAVKACSNLAVLSMLARAGAGFDIVSGGELYRVLRAGGDPARTVFSGVGKTAEEIEYALRERIHSFNCESEAEIELINSVAGRTGQKARVAVRANPDVDASTHPYISTGLREHKFGVDIGEIEPLYTRASRLAHLQLDGVSCHIGSQLLDINPMLEAVDRMIALVRRLKAAGHRIDFLDLGGGLGVQYESGDAPPAIQSVIEQIGAKVAGEQLHVVVEPGRSIVAEAGVLITRVLYRKLTASKEFVVTDAAMNDLMRPSLYKSHHEIVPVRQNEKPLLLADVVGPVCESGDFLARNRRMADVDPGDLLAVCTAGAYGFVLASNYNARLRPPEILVEGGAWRIVRARESYEDLVRGETVQSKARA